MRGWVLVVYIYICTGIKGGCSVGWAHYIHTQTNVLLYNHCLCVVVRKIRTKQGDAVAAWAFQALLYSFIY